MATTTSTPRHDPWDRLPRETNPAWAAFQHHRDTGLDRSNAKTARALGKAKQTIDEWSRKHQWVARCIAYDAMQDREWQKEILAARRKAARRNVATAEAMMKVAGQSLMELAKKPNLGAGDIARLVEVGSKLERLVLGEATENVQHVGSSGPGGDVSVLTDEERLARMRALRREVDSRLEDRERELGAGQDQDEVAAG